MAHKAIVNVFEKIATAAMEQIQHNHEQIATLAALRDTLLPKLLSGEIRIPEAEQAVEEATA
jgi:type I restriction enzyme S subunit